MTATKATGIRDVIADLNDRPYLPGVHRFMLMARVQRAAKLGDVDAQRYVELFELNLEVATMH